MARSDIDFTRRTSTGRRRSSSPKWRLHRGHGSSTTRSQETRTDVFRQTVGGPVFSLHTIGGSCVPRLQGHGQTFSAKHLEALCSPPHYWRVLCSASTGTRTDVFRQTLGGPVFSTTLLEGPVFRVYRDTDRLLLRRSCCCCRKHIESAAAVAAGTDGHRQTVGGPVFLHQTIGGPVFRRRLFQHLEALCSKLQTIGGPVFRHGQTHAVFARTLRQILTRVGRVVERIVPLHHAERRGKSSGQSFARMFCNSNSAFFGSFSEPPPPWLHIVPLKTQSQVLPPTLLRSPDPKAPSQASYLGSTVRGE